MVKLHLCCGDIYLDGYINVDIDGQKLRKGQKNPNLTTLKHYYQDRKIGEKRKPIIDKKMNLTKRWSIRDNYVDEIVMISAIEHFTKLEALFILRECYRVLKKNGKLIIDFPDLAETICIYEEVDPDMCMRLIYCNHKNPFSVHKWGYTLDSFEDTLKKVGKWRKYENKTIVKHDYPMTGVVATK